MVFDGTRHQCYLHFSAYACDGWVWRPEVFTLYGDMCATLERSWLWVELKKKKRIEGMSGKSMWCVISAKETSLKCISNGIYVNTGSSNGLVPSGTKPLLDPMSYISLSTFSTLIQTFSSIQHICTLTQWKKSLSTSPKKKKCFQFRYCLANHGISIHNNWGLTYFSSWFQKILSWWEETLPM